MKDVDVRIVVSRGGLGAATPQIEVSAEEVSQEELAAVVAAATEAFQKVLGIVEAPRPVRSS